MGVVADQPIDFAHLDKYVCGDTALLDEILSIFVEQAESWRARLTSDLGDEDWRFVCHSLKGASRGIGAWELGELAEKGEHLSAQSDDDGARARLLDDINRSVAKAVTCALEKRDQVAA